MAALHAAALAVLEEYYEAVHVVKRDPPEAMRALLAEPGAAMWLAYLGEEIVGCVVLRPLPSVARAGECKRLYVKPAARGLHIADRLMDALEDFARGRGTDWIYLDSHDGLKAAIALYERRGYEYCPRYNDNPQATVFLRKQISPHHTA
ncbi:MAG: GNAT family N-acetyltransferase [Acidobacteriota bacterium]